ncbi:4Fe-4S ferredoxin, iron-sulfur binding protein, partial [mine drainage metagenome]
MLRSDFPAFLRAIQGAGYRVVGPTVRDGAIVLGEIREETDLPIGWTERQEAGTYRLERRDDAALFGFTVGPHSWKKYLFPPRERLWIATADGTSFRVAPEPVDPTPYAFLGMRGCDLAAVRISDRVFDGAVHDPGYRGRRARALRIAVQCGQAAPTCFCTSMGTGPGVGGDHDLALTELIDPGPHAFWSRWARPRVRPCWITSQRSPPFRAMRPRRRASSPGRPPRSGAHLDPVGIRDLLLDHPDHPRW